LVCALARFVILGSCSKFLFEEWGPLVLQGWIQGLLS
jgi:hypothetical protein